MERNIAERLIPYGERVIIKKAEIKSGLIIIPESSKEKSLAQGEVICLGPNCTFLNIGDYVIFGKYAAGDFSFGGEQLSVINEEDVICIDTEHKFQDLESGIGYMQDKSKTAFIGA